MQKTRRQTKSGESEYESACDSAWRARGVLIGAERLSVKETVVEREGCERSLTTNKGKPYGDRVNT
jgi:hypothetical protein